MTTDLSKKLNDAEKYVVGERGVEPELLELIEAATTSVKETAQRNTDGLLEDFELQKRAKLNIERGLKSGKLTQAKGAELRSKLTEFTVAYVDDYIAHGSLAYNFTVMPDGSVLAIYVLRAGGKVELEAFESFGMTRGWRPA